MRTSLLALVATSTIACKPPPPAPDDLEELCKYIFANMGEETVDEPAELLAGLTNLDTCCSQKTILPQPLGYQIENLDEEAIANLDGQDRTIRETLIGAAVSHRHSSSMEDLNGAMFVVDWNDIAKEPTFIRPPICADPNCLSIAPVGGTNTRPPVFRAGLTSSRLSQPTLARAMGRDRIWLGNGATDWLVEQGTVTPDSFGIVPITVYQCHRPTRDGDITAQRPPDRYRLWLHPSFRRFCQEPGCEVYARAK